MSDLKPLYPERPKPTATIPAGWAKIETLKKGDFFKRKPDAKEVYVKADYCREDKKYQATKWSDHCAYLGFKKGTLVFVEFEF